MKYIMIIDDSPTIRISVEFAVKSLGYNTKQAGNGKEGLLAIEALKAEGNEIALCIVDINMPEMDGITFIKEFKKVDSFTPVIILTTESEKSKIEEGKQAGASGWMIKPFQTDELLATVKKLIR